MSDDLKAFLPKFTGQSLSQCGSLGVLPFPAGWALEEFKQLVTFYFLLEKAFPGAETIQESPEHTYKHLWFPLSLYFWLLWLCECPSPSLWEALVQAVVRTPLLTT